MEDRQYAAISGYLEHGTHPAAFTKSHKFVAITKELQKLQTIIIKDKLYYMEQIQDGSDGGRLVKRSVTDNR